MVNYFCFVLIFYIAEPEVHENQAKGITQMLSVWTILEGTQQIYGLPQESTEKSLVLILFC